MQKLSYLSSLSIKDNLLKERFLIHLNIFALVKFYKQFSVKLLIELSKNGYSKFSDKKNHMDFQGCFVMLVMHQLIESNYFGTTGQYIKYMWNGIDMCVRINPTNLNDNMK